MSNTIVEMMAELPEEPILRRDIKAAAGLMSRAEARWLVSKYYDIQEDRIRSAHRTRVLNAAGEPNDIMAYLTRQNDTLEKQIRLALDYYSRGHAASVWARSILGVGPVIAAGLLAHIDIDKAPYPSSVWKFAGLDPTTKWSKGEKRPWNAELKRLAYIIGESFVKVSARPNDYYGHVWREAKDREIARNEAGELAEEAKRALAAKNYGKQTDARAAYEAGKLPPAHIHARARRVAVKRFLADFHCVLHWIELGRPPPRPYVINHGGHSHYVGPPNIEILPGLREALAVLPTRQM